MDECFMDRIKRLLFGRIKVCSIPLAGHLVEVKDAGFEVTIKRLNPNIGVRTESWSFPKDVVFKVYNMSLCANDVKVSKAMLEWRGVDLKKVKLHKLASVRSKVNLCKALPQARTNKAVYASKGKFCEKGTILITAFCPIIRSKVVKLVLSKKDGILLVWYSNERGNDVPYCLVLCRKLDGQSKGEDVFWLWVPMKPEICGGG